MHKAHERQAISKTCQTTFPMPHSLKEESKKIIKVAFYGYLPRAVVCNLVNGQLSIRLISLVPGLLYDLLLAEHAGHPFQHMGGMLPIHTNTEQH